MSQKIDNGRGCPGPTEITRHSMLKRFKKGGIHPNPMKLTAGRPILATEAPREVRLLLSQHIGAPAKSIVKPGDEVEAGQMVAEAGGFVSAPVHTPIAGKVKKIEQVRDAQGLWKEAILIEAPEPEEGARPASVDFDESHPLRSDEEIDRLSGQEIIEIVGQAGIVGLGGAAFPTRVKLTIPQGKKAEVFIINGAECEPYLTCDDALMRRYPREIVAGLRYLMKATSAPRALIGIEANKPEAIAALTDAVKDYPEIEVSALRTAYPQGGETQLIEALTGRVVPAGGLPIDAGAVVDNVATAFAVYRAVKFGEPLMKRVVTVTGVDVENGGNFIAANGMATDRLIELAGGLPENTGKVIGGGPMMGRAMSTVEAPLTKGSGGILIVPEKESGRGVVSPCIRCCRCVSVCPMSLEPYLLQNLGQFGMAEEAREAGVLNCMECGCCSYICPANRPIVDYIRLSKLQIRKLPK